jgi:hypothetical protein
MFAWLPGSAQSAIHGGEHIVPLNNRSQVASKLSCTLITAGSFAADVAKEYGPLSRLRKVHCLLFDESQGFGKADDAQLFPKMEDGGFVKFIGDPDQPGGASFEKLQKRLLKLLDKRHPAFRHPAMIADTAERMIQFLMQSLIDSKADQVEVPNINKGQLYQACIDIVECLSKGLYPPLPLNNAQAAGLPCPLMLAIKAGDGIYLYQPPTDYIHWPQPSCAWHIMPKLLR